MQRISIDASPSVIERYRAEISAVADLVELERRLREILLHYDVSTFNYGAGRLNSIGGPVVERYWTTMDPAWLKRYIECGYQRTDRLVAAGMSSLSPFFFDDVFSTPAQLPEQVEMETMFPYRRGYVVPMHSPFGRFGILSAVDDAEGEREWRMRRYEKLSAITLIATLTHQRAEQISSNQLYPLSIREKEVLKWVAAGKTSAEVALVLGITERTVKKHIASCMEKTCSDNRVELVAKALLGGVIVL
jgi:DNA-binding CsgD family transcriptional regulator